MIAMAWGCDSNARDLGRRALIFYDSEPDSAQAAIAAAKQQRDAGQNKRQILRTVLLISLRCDPDRIHRVRRPGAPEHRHHPVHRRRGPRRALTRDRRHRHRHPPLAPAPRCARAIEHPHRRPQTPQLQPAAERSGLATKRSDSCSLTPPVTLWGSGCDGFLLDVREPGRAHRRAGRRSGQHPARPAAGAARRTAAGPRDRCDLPFWTARLHRRAICRSQMARPWPLCRNTLFAKGSGCSRRDPVRSGVASSCI